MGNTCMPVADSFLYMAEPINIVKFKNKIKFKKEEEKEKKNALGISPIFPNCEKLLYLLLSASVSHFRGLLRSKVWTMEKHLAPELGGDITGLNWTLKETKKENAKT